MRLISFSLTTPQFIDGTKTVTRRLGWRKLKVGDRLQAVEKAMGLRKGQQVVRLGVIEIVSIRREPLSAMTDDDCAREGFPQFCAREFIAMLASHNGSSADVEVTRIEFHKLEPIRRQQPNGHGAGFGIAGAA